MAAVDDQVDAYLRLTDRLRQEEDVFVRELLIFLRRIVVLLKKDIQSDKSDLCQASLQALGHCLYQQQIASSISFTDGQDLVKELLDRILGSEDKGVCTRALWCLAKQNLDNAIIKSQLGSILLSLESVITKDLQSITVDHEALNVIERLLQQVPKSDLIKTADSWSKLVFPMLVSSAAKVRERALAVMSTGLEHLISSQDKVVKILLPMLKGCLLKEFPKLCSEKKELFVLKCWCCIVPILGETLHKGGSLINEMLKLVEQGFRNQSVEVQVMSFSAWNILIDNFALSSDVLCSSRRVKLIMTPLRNLAVKERNEAVETARLSTWWHYVCSLGPQVQELFEQVCTPLLQFIFGTAVDQMSSLKTREGLSELKCPPTPTNSKFMTDMMAETPKSSIRRSLRDVGTPKTPTVLNASFAKMTKQKLLTQGCQILLELLTMNDDELNGNLNLITSLERLQTVIFKKPENFKKHSCLLMNAVREGFKALGQELSEPLAAKIWSLLVARINQLLEKGSSADFSEMLLPLLAVLQDLVDSNVLAPSLQLKMLCDLSSLQAEALSHHMAALHSKDNPQGSPALLLVQLLFMPHLLENIWENERLHLTFEHLINCGMKAASGHLLFLKTVLNLLEKASSSILKRDALWRLWIFVAEQIIKYIQKTNDVNQGDALEHDFSTLYLVLQFPMKHLLNASLSQDLVKESSKTVAELYRSFSRAASLVPTAETNICCEELCYKILALGSDWRTKDVAFIDSLVNLTGVIIECLDFTIPGLFAMATTAAGKSPTASPSKWNKRLQKPMGNFTSLVHMIVKLLSACEKTTDCQESPQTLGVLAAVLTSLIDKLSYFFVHINGATAITSILKTLTPALRIYLENAHASAKIAQATLDKRLFTTRLIQKIEKLWVDLLTCVQTRHGGPYDSDFLTVMSPLLEVTFCHPKRSIKNHTVMFWNATFANSQSLDYPEGLRPILQIAKDKMSLTLPGWENIKVSAKESQLETESEDLTQQVEIIKPFPYGILTSPQRNKPPSFPGGSPQMKGSFLHRGVIADKATENSSPKLFGRSPKPTRPRNSPSGTHVRRKLPLSKYDDDDQDYVMIAPSPKKKRLLTEHQKEMMCSRSNVPALYNELDRSQDCSHFSQYTLASQAQVTANSAPSSSPDEESGLPEVQKKSEGESDPTKMDGCAIDIVSDKNEVEILDPRELESSEPGAGVVGELKVAEDIGTMEIEEKKCNIVLCERTVRSSNIESLGKGDDGVVEDTIKTSNESQIGEEEEDEVTSPDVIPSSQTSSFDSPFQSLRRVSIPLSSALPDSFDSLTKLRSVENLELEKTKLEATKSDDSVVETQRSEEHNEKEKDSVDKVAVSKTIVSPIAGRTRRKLLQKTEVNKTPSVTEPENEPTEQEVSQLTAESGKVQTELAEKSPEKVTEPKIAEISRDATSSPVPSMMNKFLRPLSAGGSPCRVTFSGNCSPGVSPTNGILKKKWPGNKPSVDSPSPPNKVRRVSFALPVKDDSCDDREKMTLIRSNASQVKKPNSSPFTAVKQRRPLPGISDQSSCQSLECVFPELVSCKVPVDQILPSILAMSWSRGMGHLVRAQNIHTIGNLSALKEDQVNNLPIKSPKVLTLKKALRRFQQTHRGKNAKPLRNACLKDAFREEDEYKDDFISSDFAQLQDELTDKDSDKETLDCKTVFVGRNEKPEPVKRDDHWQSSEPEVVDGDVAPKGMLGESYIEVGLQNKSTAVSANCDDHLGDDDLDSVEDVLCEPDVDLESKYTTVLANSEKVKGESIDESVGSEEEEPLTPPLQGHDDIGANESSNGLTPRRETCSLPTRLFTSANATPSGLETEDVLFHDRNTENVEENQIKEFCKEESTIKLEGSASPVGSTAEETAVLPLAVETDIAVDQGITAEKEKFRDCLRSLKELTSADLLREFSAEEIFETHQNLTEVMAIIVQSLKGRCQ